MKARLHWIDTVKALCIICVYMAHTEEFVGCGTHFGKLVYPFYVNAFFFISGYLMYKKYLNNDQITTFSLSTYKKGITNYIYKLVIPTIIFSIFIYLPKTLFHSQHLDFNNFAIVIFGGISFWFTSALFISQTLILTLFLTKTRNILFYLTTTATIFIVLQSICEFKPQLSIYYFPWYWRTGLIYTFIMTLGGVYATLEKKINKWSLTPLAIASTVGYYMLFTGNAIACLGLSGRCTLMGIITCISTIIVLIGIAKRISTHKITTFIGKNSLVFYFLSGATPAIFATISARLGVTGILSLTLSLALSLTASYLITYIITRHLVFLTDIRVIKKQ